MNRPKSGTKRVLYCTCCRNKGQEECPGCNGTCKVSEGLYTSRGCYYRTQPTGGIGGLIMNEVPGVSSVSFSNTCVHADDSARWCSPLAHF